MKLWLFLRGIYYSLPIQLVFHQLRHHWILVFFWFFLAGVVTQNVLQDFGAAYLFLEPDYLGETSFYSMAWLGFSFAGLSLAYHLTAYILDGHHFFFILIEPKPFRTFVLNNSIIPVAFLAIYWTEFYRSHIKSDFNNELELISGFICGVLVVIIVSVVYFSYSNVDLPELLKRRDLKERKKLIQQARNYVQIGTNVQYYLSGLLIKKIHPGSRINPLKLLRILNQHHANALVAEGLFLLSLFLLSFFQGFELFQIPAASSFLALFSIVLMGVGAISYWFRRLGHFMWPVIIGIAFLVNNWFFSLGQHQLFGISYSGKLPEYNSSVIHGNITDERVTEDSLYTVGWLENWRTNCGAAEYSNKPKMVLLCASGGGLRSAVWTGYCLDTLNRITGGHLLKHTALMTGASGGMIGLSVFREFLLKKNQDSTNTPQNTLEITNLIAGDLLNPIISFATLNSFRPLIEFTFQDKTYCQDRGFAFEQKLSKNTHCFEDKPIGRYLEPEYKAIIPWLIFSPTIVNDGRKLYLTPQKVSWLCKPTIFNPSFSTEIDGVEFREICKGQQPDSLWMTSAIRANASFPYVLPFPEIPTRNHVRLMDAGANDNFGISTALRFCWYFRNWIGKNTSGIIIVQFRDTPRKATIEKLSTETVFGSLLSTIGESYRSVANSKSFINDQLLAQCKQNYPINFQLIEFQYLPVKEKRNASLNFHLTKREKQDILNSFSHEENQKALNELLNQLY